MKAAGNACPAGWARYRSAPCWIRSSPGRRTPEDLAQLEKLCLLVKRTSLCGLGQSAPNPVLSTLKYFRHEYEALINQADRVGSD